MEDILGIRTRWKICQVTFGGGGGGVGEKDKKNWRCRIDKKKQHEDQGDGRKKQNQEKEHWIGMSIRNNCRSSQQSKVKEDEGQ